MRDKARYLCVLLLLAVSAAGVRLSGQTPTANATGTIIQRVLVKVNGEVFTQKELEEKQIELLQQQGKGNLQGEALNQALAEMMPDLLVNAIDEMLLLQRGREMGFHLSDEQFKDSLETIKKDNNMDDAALQAALTQEGLTLDSLRARLDRTYTIRTVQQREVLGHMSLTEEELRQYYAKHPEEFVKPATVMLRELLVAVPAPEQRPGQPPSPFAQGIEDAARQKIEALRQRALQGEDFEKLVAEASDSATKSSGGVIGPVVITEMATGIRDAIDKIKPGEITEPIRTSRGFQIFKLESRTADEPLPFDAVRDDLAQKVGESRLDVETAKYLQTLRGQAIIDWKRPDLQQMYEKRLAERVKL